MRLIGTGDNAGVRVMQEPMMVRTIIGHRRLIRAPGWAATCRALPLQCAG